MNKEELEKVTETLHSVEKYIYSETVDSIHLKENEKILLDLLDKYKDEYAVVEGTQRYSFNNTLEYVFELCLGARTGSIDWIDFPVARIYSNLQSIAAELGEEDKSIEYAYRAYLYNPQDLNPLLSMTHVYFQRKDLRRFKFELFQIYDLIYNPYFLGRFFARLALYYNAIGNTEAEYACLFEAYHYAPSRDYKIRLEELVDNPMINTSNQNRAAILETYNIPSSISKYKIRRLEYVLNTIKAFPSAPDELILDVKRILYGYTLNDKYSPYKIVGMKKCGIKFQVPNDWTVIEEENDFITNKTDSLTIKRTSGLKTYVDNKGPIYDGIEIEAKSTEKNLVSKGYEFIDSKMLKTTLGKFDTSGLFQYFKSATQKFASAYFNINGYKIQIVFELDPSIEMLNNAAFEKQVPLEDFSTFINKMIIEQPEKNQKVEINVSDGIDLVLNFHGDFGEIESKGNMIALGNHFKIFTLKCDNEMEMEKIANEWLEKNVRSQTTVLNETTEYRKINGNSMIEKIIEIENTTKLYRFVFAHGKMLIFSLYEKNTNTNKCVLNAIANIKWRLK